MKYLLYTTICALFLALCSTAFAAKPQPSSISVPDTVYGSTVVATTVSNNGKYVYIQCYAPDFSGDYVYAAFFDVGSNGQTTVGPLASSLWTSGDADCKASVGYFKRNGWGNWVELASTNFHVAG